MCEIYCLVFGFRTMKSSHCIAIPFGSVWSTSLQIVLRHFHRFLRSKAATIFIVIQDLIDQVFKDSEACSVHMTPAKINTLLKKKDGRRLVKSERSESYRCPAILRYLSLSNNQKHEKHIDGT